MKHFLFFALGFLLSALACVLASRPAYQLAGRYILPALLMRRRVLCDGGLPERVRSQTGGLA